MINRVIHFHQLSEKKDIILQNVYRIINEHNPLAASDMTNKLKEHEEEEKIKIAFVGQHNAGKSTIISALTGNNAIKISTNVETDVATDYSWNDVLLTDTPGLYAGVKEEHDEISLRKIAESDLLVFAITSNLFDDLMIKSFVDLAYGKLYRNKILLLVNKMSAETGDFSDLVFNYRESLSESLIKEGGNLADFPVVYIDAHDYIEGVELDSNELIEISNFESFITSLNAFINERGILSRLDTPCRIIDTTISEEIANTGTEVDKKMMAILRQVESTILKYKRESNLFVSDQQRELRSAIMGQAQQMITDIGVKAIDEKECDRLNLMIQEVTDKVGVDIEKGLSDIQERMISELCDIWDSDMAKFVINEINSSGVKISASVASDFTKMNDAYSAIKGVLNTGGTKVINMAGGSGKLNGYVTSLSGSNLHQTVLNVGHFFGKSFKPYQALHIAQKIGNVAKALGPALAIVSSVLEIFTKVKTEADIIKINNAKKDAFNEYSTISQEIVDEVNKQYSSFEKNLFDKQLADVASSKKKLVDSCDVNNQYVSQLKHEKEEIIQLISDISEA